MIITWFFPDHSSIRTEGDLPKKGDLVYFHNYKERRGIDTYKYVVDIAYNKLTQTTRSISTFTFIKEKSEERWDEIVEQLKPGVLNGINPELREVDVCTQEGEVILQELDNGGSEEAGE